MSDLLKKGQAQKSRALRAQKRSPKHRRTKPHHAAAGRSKAQKRRADALNGAFAVEIFQVLMDPGMRRTMRANAVGVEIDQEAKHAADESRQENQESDEPGDFNQERDQRSVSIKASTRC